MVAHLKVGELSDAGGRRICYGFLAPGLNLSSLDEASQGRTGLLLTSLSIYMLTDILAGDVRTWPAT